MFKYKNRLTILFVIVIVSGLVSCNKNETEVGDIEIIGDVFILKRIIDEKIQYGHSYYLYGNYPLTSASVTTPSNETISLPASDQFSLIFSKEPTGNDYSEIIPQNGFFDFNAKITETNYNATDNLDYADMAIPQITSTEYLVSSETLKIEWNTIPGADSYVVRMINSDNDVFFTGYLMSSEATSYEININSGTWSDLPNYGQPFIVELHASRYEQGIDELEIYHIEEISIGEKAVLWGIN